ncbi:MAG: hypothetical protein WAZ19_15010 [Anaerolineae bacterium]
MRTSNKSFLAILFAGLWINASEFLRNQVLFTNYWVEHYRTLGLVFPAAPINGLVWVLWGFVFAAVLYILSRRFTWLQTATLGWVVGFMLMWLVTWNLDVLPVRLLVFAIPLSLLESGLAAFIIHKLAPASQSGR